MKTTEILNDLIEINNDRIEGYKKAAKQTDEHDLKMLFNEMTAQSNQYVSELKVHVTTVGETSTNDTTFKGKIYRSWMDIKAGFGGDDRKGILCSCEFGEDAAQKAYEAALKHSEITGEIRALLIKQEKSLNTSHDKIKRMRDKALS